MKTTTLTQRHDEICINGNIRISVGRVEHGRVRLAIEAPKDVAVHREEVYTAICQRNANNDQISR